jgi:hypothetical protein
MWLRIALVLAAAAFAGVAYADGADEWDPVSGFGSAPWVSGTGIAGQTFQPNAGVGFVNFGPITIDGTLVIPQAEVILLPVSNADAIVQFTAPESGIYSYSGGFELLDSNPTAIDGEVLHDHTKLYSGVMTGPPANLDTFSPGGAEFFNGSVLLNTGDTLSFAIANDGDLPVGATGFFAMITCCSTSAVPEASTWLMLLVGLAAAGAMLRTRRSTVIAV